MSLQKFALTVLEPMGNSLAVVALVGMVLVVGVSVYRVRAHKAMTIPPVWWQIPLLAAVGVLMSGYLAFLATRPETAVCLPAGDCRILQQSLHAQPLGLPIGFWGLSLFLGILLVWFGGQFGPDWLRAAGPWLLFSLTGVGQLYAVYFTFLEPFVIGATCGWCLATAVVMTILFWLSAEALNGVRMTRFL